MKDQASDPGSEASDVDLEAVLGQAPLHPRDRVPDPVRRLVVWMQGRWSAGGRYRAGVVLALVAFAGATAVVVSRLLDLVVGVLDPIAYLGLFIVTWLGWGGILVPIPGVRILGLVVLAQQSAVGSPMEAAVVAVVAMTLGQLSYYVAGAESARRYASGDHDVEDVTAMLGAGSGLVEPTRPGIRARAEASLRAAQERARPVIERRGLVGIFGLSLLPTPATTAAAFVSGSLGFGFGRFIVASAAAHTVLAFAIVAVAVAAGQTVD